MGKNKKKRKQAKRGEKKGIKDAARRRRQHQVRMQLRRLLHGGQKLRMQPAPVADDPRVLKLDSEITLPDCNGAGDCCKNRLVYVEPSDVWRIMRNERAREKFHLETTTDLYAQKEGDTSKPLVCWVDERSNLPMCAVRRVEIAGDQGTKDQVCPFFVPGEDGALPECLLGDDRLTQCKADPVVRMDKAKGGRRLSAWKYMMLDLPCMACKSCSETTERTMLTEEWLRQNDMEDRMAESGQFHGYINWLRGMSLTEKHWHVAADLLFDWHHFSIEFLGLPKDEVMATSPETPSEVYIAARALMEGMLVKEQYAKAQEQEEVPDAAEGAPEADPV